MRQLMPLVEQDREGVLTRFRLLAGSSRLSAQLWVGYRRNVDAMAATLGARLGRDPGDLEVRVTAAAIVGALLETVYAWAASDGREDFGALLERALDQLAALGP